MEIPFFKGQFYATISSGDQNFIEYITHWMPLPDPPKKKRWIPNDSETCYMIDFKGEINRLAYSAIYVNYFRLTGYYKTHAEALNMRDKIKAFVTEQIGEE